MTAADLAREMGVTYQVVQYHCRAGHLRDHATKIDTVRGPAWLVSRKAADRFKATYRPWRRQGEV